MKKYTILSFNFNGYDKIREPLIQDPNAEYIYVTDRITKSQNWKVIIDPRLVNKNPIYSSYYVRYHPFEYAKTDLVIVIDSSIQLKDSLEDIVNDFTGDMLVMCSNYKNDIQKINYWIKLNRITIEDVNQLQKIPDINEKGSTCSAVQMYKNTDKVRQFQNEVWTSLLKYGNYGLPNRLDEVIFHKTLKNYNLDIFPVSVQLYQSTYMDYCVHNSDYLINKYTNYDQMYYLNGKPVKPFRYDKNINFPKSYDYNTEAILLTKYLNPDDLREWLDWHLNVCKFEHIKVYDNQSNYDVRSICKEFNNVDYELVLGIPRQYKIYDKHFTKSKAKWIMPIDDDEYLQLSKDFKSVYEAICYYENKFPHMNMLAVRWKHLFPKVLHSERTGKVLDYCTEENPLLAKTFMHLGDGTIKTIVKNYGIIHYEETKENPAGGHVPKNSTFLGALLCNGMPVLGCGLNPCPDFIEDEKIRLLHCRYKGFTEYTNKIKEIQTISDETHNKKNWPFNDILPLLS